MKRLILCMTFLATMLFGGCAFNANVSQLKALSNDHLIVFYSGTDVQRVHVSAGAITNESGSDGYMFMDRATNRYTTLSGNVFIDTLPNGYTDAKDYMTAEEVEVYLNLSAKVAPENPSPAPK